MKRILYLHAGAELYGADKVLLDLIKGLDKKRFEAHVILPNEGVLVGALQSVGARVSVMDYPILRRKYFNLKGILTYIRSYRRASKELLAYAQSNQIDVVHNNTTAVLEGIYLKRKLGLPLLWHVHEIIVKPKLISHVINCLMGVWSDKIVTVSQAVRDHIASSPFIRFDQIEVVYNGVDNTLYAPSDARPIRERFGIAPTALVVGMIGRVNAWKGQQDFLRAMIPLLQEKKDSIAFLAGSAFEGEEWRVSELETQIAASPVADQIKRIDYYKDTNQLYNLFDVFVLPSTNPDPLPTVVLEAMACGKPVVGYRHGGVCEMVAEGENGLLVAPCQPEQLTQAISRLLENADERQAFGQESIRRQGKHFSLTTYVANFSRLYNQLTT